MENVLVKGFELAALGMGTVFVFLTLLVAATSLMSLLILKFDQEVAPQSLEVGTDQMINSRLIAVISAAVQQFRSDHEAS